MFSWYVITHNLHAFQLVTCKIRALGVEIFSPSKIKVTKRADCSGVRTSETPLFPGYLFVRLDPELVHTTAISDIPGVKDFVRFGGDICIVSDSLIEALKKSLLLRVDQKVSQIEYRNVTPAVVAALESISVMKSKDARQVAFFELIKKESTTLLNSNPKSSRIVSVIERPFVNELIR
jgi:transcriptional antiterminator RfaH